MAVRSTQLCAVQRTTEVDADVYTVPSGRRTILKDVFISERGGTAYSSSLWIEGAFGSVLFDRAAPLAAYGVRHLEVWIVMNAGDQLHWYSNAPAGAVAGLIASGAELLL